jgi:hypothetical protein
MLEQGIMKILPELVSGRCQPEGLTEGQGAKSPSTMLRMVPLPEASSGRIF